MKKNNLYVLRKTFRDHSYSCRKEFVDSYLRLAESGNWNQIREHFGLERKGR